MGLLLDAQRRRGAAPATGKKPDPTADAVESQKEGIKYGTGAAGEELAAATREDVIKLGTSTLIALEAAGITRGREYERAAKMKVQGYDPEVVEKPFLAKAGESLSWLDKLGATVRFGIGDILQLDQKQGTEFDGDDFADIWGGNWQSIVARHGEDAVGQEGRFGGQAMLNAAGWQLEEKKGTASNWLERNAHGLASLVLEIGTDPLTYVTAGASAVGKKAGLSATNALAAKAGSRAHTILKAGLSGKVVKEGVEHAFERNIMERVAARADDLVAAATKAGDDLGEKVVIDLVERERFLGVAMDEVMDEVLTKEGGAVARRAYKELSPEFISYAQANNKAFLGGGVRLTPRPLGSGGVYVPGTRGAGRAITQTVFGTPVGSTAKRGFLAREVADPLLGSGIRGVLDRPTGLRLTTRWRDLMDKVASENRIVRGIAEGREGAAGVLRAAETSKRIGQAIGSKKIGKAIANAGVDLNTAMRKAGMGEQEGQELFQSMMGSISGGKVFAETVEHPNPEVRAAAEAFAGTWRSAFDEMHAIAKKHGMDIGYIDNYVPLVKSKQLVQVFEQMESRSIGVVIPEGLEEADLVGYQLLSEMYAAWVRRGRGGRVVIGEAKEAEQRILGRSVAFNDMGDTSIIEMLDGGQIVFPNHGEMNKSISKALAEVADEYRVPIGRNFTALESNPYELANRYFNSMNEAIAETILVNEAKRVGLIRSADFQYDLGRMLSALDEKLKKLPKGVREKLAHTLEKTERGRRALEAAVDLGLPVGPTRKPVMKKIKIGEIEQYVDEAVLADPRVVKAVKDADRTAVLRASQKGKQAASVKMRLNALKEQGLSDEVANLLAQGAEFDYIDEVHRTILAVQREQAATLVAGNTEYLARVLGERGNSAAVVKALRQGEMEADQAAVAAARQAAEDAIARAKAKAGVRPVSAVVFDTPEASRALAQQLEPVVRANIEAMAAQADNIPGGEQVAAKLRELFDEFGNVGDYGEDSINRMSALLIEAKDLMDVVTHGKKQRMSMAEWVNTRPKRYRKMGYTEQQRVMDEWAESGIRSVPPVPDVASPEVERLARREGMNITSEANASVQASLEGNIRNVKAKGLPLEDLGPIGTDRVMREPQTGLTWIEDADGNWISAVRANRNGVGGYAATKEGMEGQGFFTQLMQIAERKDPELVYKLAADEYVSEPMADWIQGWAKRKLASSGAGDEAILRRDEAWFEAFKANNGVDLRELSAADRRHLKTLLADVPDDASGFAAHDAAKAKILSVDTGRNLEENQIRTVQHMFLDIVEDVKSGGRGQRKPGWAQIDVEEARRMDPRTFQANYAGLFGEGVLADERLRGVYEAVQLMYGEGFVGKQLDAALAVGIAEEVEVLAALNAGRGIYRDARLRDVFHRMFSDSGLSLEYSVKGTRGGRVKMESFEQIEMLTVDKLNKELAMVGFHGDIQGAAKALVDGSLNPSKLSPAARNTLSNIPKQDMRAIDNLSQVLKDGTRNVLSNPAEVADRGMADVVAAISTHKRLEAALLKVGADGNMTAGALDAAESILKDAAQMRRLKKVLPRDQWAQLDGVADMVATHRALKGADARVKRLVRDSQALREHTMFDPREAMDTIKQVTDEIAAARTDEALKDYQGTIDIFEKLVETIKEMNSMAPDPRTGLTRSLWATETELETVDRLGKEGARYAKQLGFDDIGEVLQDAKRGGVVPTAERANFLPASGFGLAGPKVEGKILQADLGAFIEQTMRTMMAAQTPAGLQAYARGARQVLHWWKGMATVARPTFHVRNAMSAFWNNTMIDVRMQDYKFVAKHTPSLRKAFHETGDWVTAARSLDDPMAAYMFEQAAMAGLFDSTFAQQEILRKMAKEQALGRNFQKLNPLSQQGPLIKAGGIAMENIEDFFRLAAFVRHMPNELAGSADSAVLAASAGYANDMVNMVHFDYANLTAVEERIKDWIPFFVWTRRNLPLQMRALVEQPRMISRYNHLIHVGNDMSDSRDEGPRKYGGQMFIGTDMVMNEDTPFWAKLIFDPDIPVKDLFEIENPLSPASYLNLVTGMLGPQIQEPMKIAFQDPYKTTAPAGWSGITRAFAAAVDGNADLDTNPRIDSRVASVMKLVFPPASEYLTAFERDPVRMQKQGIVEGDVGSRVRAGLRDLVLPGLGFQTTSPAADYSVYQSSLQEGRDVLTEMRKRGLVTPETDAAADELKKLLNP